MKRGVTIFAAICGLLAYTMAAPAFSEFLLSSGVRYDLFSDDLVPESHGFEITIPLGMAYKQEHYSVSMETAYVNATVEPSAESTARFSHLTDTLLSVAYTYSFPERPLGIIAGLNLNLPTGREQLSEREHTAEAGQQNDLFEVDNFGDGFNAGLSLGLVGDIGEFSLGIEGAYIFNGRFDPGSDSDDDELDPGDQILGIALLGWQAASRLTLDAFVAYSHFFPDHVDGEENFREGDNVVVGGNLRYERDPLGIVVSLQGTVPQKDDLLIAERLRTEPQNSSGNDFFGLVDMTYRPSQKLILRVLGDIRYYGESDLNDEFTGLPFEGRRVRYAIGPGIIYGLNAHLSCNSLLKYFHMTSEPDVTEDEDVTFRGLNLDVGFTYTF